MALPSRVIVTGAAQGIGRAVALKLATRGAHIALWDVQTEGVKETAERCRAQGAIVRACTVDVGDTGQIATAVADFVREWGEPDGLVNNAGIFPGLALSTCSYRNGSACCASISQVLSSARNRLPRI